MRAPARVPPRPSPARRNKAAATERRLPARPGTKRISMGKEATRVRRREKKNIASGVAHVNATFNNTMITITDAQGNTISWSSAGTMGFKGSRKSTPYAAQVAGEDAARKAQEHGMRTLEVEVSGPGAGRESALRALQAAGFTITATAAVTPMPPNGCRPRKRGRVGRTLTAGRRAPRRLPPKDPTGRSGKRASPRHSIRWVQT